jgi:hypothetical protein
MRETATQQLAEVLIWKSKMNVLMMSKCFFWVSLASAHAIAVIDLKWKFSTRKKIKTNSLDQLLTLGISAKSDLMFLMKKMSSNILLQHQCVSLLYASMRLARVAKLFSLLYTKEISMMANQFRTWLKRAKAVLNLWFPMLIILT